MRTQFITFEGSEACGKSTQLARLQSRLVTAERPVTVTREPGGTLLGEAVRNLLKHAPEGRGMSPEAELLLFAASRAELVRKVIAPALQAGGWVLSDRFYDSTLVYQGVARGLGVEPVAWLNAFAVGETHPGLTLVLDLTVEEAQGRLRQRGCPEGQSDRMEEQSREFFAKVRAGYEHLARREPGRVRLIDAQGTPEEVAGLVWKEVAHAFQL